MNLNRFSILIIIFGILCIVSMTFYFFNKLDSNYIVLMLGLTQLFSGLSHIKTSKSLDGKEGYNGNKIIEVVISIMGLFLVIASSIKILEK
ncbi:hypothetical protein [Clostridium sp.]|uniref:hypothetical protein n=1 Tax=Clostridium sp. TaxID=1506 RepID=UPI001DB98D86|nr:hypothetical protein [Clostridium sp.]MBS5939755.1 hypothetical protein [Clostridium sp.]